MSREERVLAALNDGGKLRGSWWKANCPFCLDRVGKEDRDRCLSVHSESGGFHCFRCRARGRVTLPEDLVIERRPVSTQRNELKIEPPPFFTLLASGSGKDAVSLKPARDYLRSRGLPEDVWEAANIGACAAGPYAGRVVIPVLAEDGKTWFGFSSRLWTAKCDKRLKYRNAVGEWKSHVVYNPNALTEETDEPCYVVEGCFDALAHWPHAVAVLGDASDAQVEIMSKARRPLVVVLDGDAWVKGWSLAMKLRLEGVTAGAVQLPPGKDPDEVDPSWLWEEARASLA
jgi:hypothetical protein